MTKTIISLLFATLLFTACVERGQVFITKLIPMKSTKSMHKTASKTDTFKNKPIKKLTKKLLKVKTVEKVSHNIVVDENKSIKKVSSKLDMNNTIQTQKKKSDENTLFQLPLSDEMKNNISGFFIVMIGLMILF